MESNGNLLNNERGSGVVHNNSLHEQESQQDRLFSSIAISPNDFNGEEWVKTFSEFSKVYKKLLYAKLSSNIISHTENEFIENLENNLSSVVESITADTKGESLFIHVDEDCYNLFLKFYDHCNLAMTQRAVYLKTEQEFKAISSKTEDDVKKSLKNATEEITEHVKQSEEKIDSAEKNITGQLIGLVSIFTALSFVIFGGINVLGSLMSDVRYAPVGKLLVLADVWFLCMFNVFFIFVKFIAALTGRKPERLWIYFAVINSTLIILLIIILLSAKCRIDMIIC